jgi:hypothetical protein
MEEEKVDVQEEVVEQEEETTTEEETEETTEDETEGQEETVTISKSKLKAMQHKAIAYDSLKKRPSQEKDIIKTKNSLDPDELKLIAKGVSDEVIEKAKIVSKGSGISLLEAISDPLVVAYEKQLKEVERKEKARLGASNGSNTYSPEKKFKVGMTKEEHKNAWRELMEK